MDVDIAFANFNRIAAEAQDKINNPQTTEADSRAKIIDPIFKECLGWTEKDISREEHVHEGFIDYIFRTGDRPAFVLEAKKTGKTFEIPFNLSKRRYRIDRAISTEESIMAAIEQAQRYAIEIGSTFAVVSNGHQYIVFETFKHSGKWREGHCIIFRSLDEMRANFGEFWNLLSQESVLAGSLRRELSEITQPLSFKRLRDSVHNPDAICGRNHLSQYLTPIMQYAFGDLTSDSKTQVLSECYIEQEHTSLSEGILKSHFGPTPKYGDAIDINWFRDEKEHHNFVLSFDKCREFIRQQVPMGFNIMLLGGIGAGKTTFIHHFFRVAMADRSDIIWFYVDFGRFDPDSNKIEQTVYDCIAQCYEEHYRGKLEGFFKSVGLDGIKPNFSSILRAFSMLRFVGKSISVVLDNIDKHSITSPTYQEHVIQFSQSFTNRLKTITILTLREESYFRSTKTGSLDAYQNLRFHIDSPNFEELLRARVNFTLRLLQGPEEEIMKVIRGPIPPAGIWEDVKKLFGIVNVSIRKDRRVGKMILSFINDVSGRNMRKALDFFSTYMTSANTNIEEMIEKESKVAPNSPMEDHYQIPLHHIIKSIMLEERTYYSSSQSNIMNIFHVNPQYTSSHFLHLRLLFYLYRRLNFYTTLEEGFVSIDEVLDNAASVGISEKAIEDSFTKLGENGLVEFDNQDPRGYKTATYARITTMGRCYFKKLIRMFAYFDLILYDTPISDENTFSELRKRIIVDSNFDEVLSMNIRFERTRVFLEYLKAQEEAEYASNLALADSDLTRPRFVGRIIKRYEKEVQYIRTRIERKHYS